MTGGSSPGGGSHVFKILARREGHNRADLLWMFGRDLEDKRRRIAAAPQDHGQVLGRGPIKGCLEVWRGAMVAYSTFLPRKRFRTIAMNCRHGGARK